MVLIEPFIDYNNDAYWTIYWLAVQLSCHTQGQFEFRFQPVHIA